MQYLLSSPTSKKVIARDREAKHRHLVSRHRKCLYLCHYHIYPLFGFMHARIQIWFPFNIQICLNGRAWLARAMDQAGVGCVQTDDRFIWIEDPERANGLIDKQVTAARPALLDSIARGMNPHHEAMFQAYPIDYDWTVDQSASATNIMFRDAKPLAPQYPDLVHHGLTTFLSRM